MNAFWSVVLSNAVVAASLALIVAAIGRIWKNPVALHLLWLLVLVKLTTPPLVTVGLPLSSGRLPPTLEEATVSDVTPLPPTEAVPRFRAPAREAYVERSTMSGPTDGAASIGAPLMPRLATKKIDWLRIAGWAWLAGIVVIAAARAWRIGRFQRLLRAGEGPPPSVLAAAQRIGGQLGLRRIPEIRLLPVRMSPLVWSLGGRARVLLPAELFGRLDADAQEAILAHELAHVRRKDHWIRLLELAVSMAFWWHPAVWWACRELRELEEQCCDALVLGTVPCGARAYATALVNLLDWLSERSVVAPLAATGAKSSVSLTRRITMLKNHVRAVRITTGHVLLLLAFAAVPMAVAFGAERPKAGDGPPSADRGSIAQRAGSRGGQDQQKNPASPPAPAANSTSTVQRRAVNKLVKDFPEKPDLSTPESALAALCRALGRNDILGMNDMLVVPFAKDDAEEIRFALKHDPHAPKNLNQTMLGVEVVEVLTVRDAFAFVIYKVKTLKGSRPYQGAPFARTNGQWKGNPLGNAPSDDDKSGFPTVQAARDYFDKNKDNLWKAIIAAKGSTFGHPAKGDQSSKTAAQGNDKSRPPSPATSGEVQEWMRDTWRLNVRLDAPNLDPPAVQFAVVDKDPLPGFAERVGRMKSYFEDRMKHAETAERKEVQRFSSMMVDWDQGFRDITGDKLYLLTPSANTISSSRPGGEKWIVTKVVRIKDKAVCWCIPVEVKRREEVNVILREDNAFDLASAFDMAMRVVKSDGGPSSYLQVPGGGTIAFGPGGVEHFDEVKKLIAEKKYKFVRTFDSPSGQKQYGYRFTCADGYTVNMNFSMRLEDVTSWEDYVQRRGKQGEQR